LKDQNAFEGHRRLSSRILISVNGFGVEFINENGIFESLKTTTRTNKHKALSLLEAK